MGCDSVGGVREVGGGGLVIEASATGSAGGVVSLSLERSTTMMSRVSDFDGTVPPEKKSRRMRNTAKSARCARTMIAACQP
jgi:hypothetical protein